jgi:phosphatidate cytidylyltransferase
MCFWSTTRDKQYTDLKNLVVRTVTGGVFVAAIVASAVFSPQIFALLFLFITMAGMMEFLRLTKKSRLADMLPALISGLLVYGVIALVSLSILHVRLLWLILAVMVAIPAVNLFLNRKDVLNASAIDIASLVFVVVPLALLNMFLDPWLIPGYHTPWFLIGMLAILWAHDTFAYLFGSIFGKHPLYKAISPKKSVEGSIGGFGFAIIVAYIISIFVTALPMWAWIGIALIVTVFGTLGDLAESALKRRAGVKDSGNLLPGHGGILDRFDSLLLVSPLVFVFVILFR